MENLCPTKWGAKWRYIYTYFIKTNLGYITKTSFWLVNKVGNWASPRYRIYRYRYMDVKFQFEYRQSKLRDDGNLDCIFGDNFWFIFGGVSTQDCRTITSQRVFLCPIENTLKWLPGSSKGCWMDDKGCPYTIPWIQTEPLGRCWYAIENTLNWSWPEIFPFHILFCPNFSIFSSPSYQTYHNKNPGETTALAFCLKKMQMEISAPKQMEKDIMSASHLWAFLGKKGTYKFAWLQQKVYVFFFFSAAHFLKAVVPFFFLER